MTNLFQIGGQGAQAYEQYLVPTFFVECAERLFEVAPPKPGERLVDVACGTG